MLQALRTIEIESEELGLFGYVNFEVGVFSLPELPGLQSLKFRSVGRSEVAGPLLWSSFIRIHPRWNSLTNLEIDWTPFLAADLKDLIIKSPQLTDLTWRIRICHDQPDRYFDFGGLGAMLRQGRKLKRVDIRLDVQAEPSVNWAISQIRWGPGGSAETGQTWGVTERIGSLKALQHLEELSIPLCALFGWEPPEDAGDVQWEDCLPASLRMLHVSQDLSDMKGYLWSNCWPTVRMCRALCAARLLGIAVEAPQRGDHRQCVRDGGWRRAS
ncbi:hypothetical protein GTA08_BOTSDO08113 [Neofusicoccum parvum]|uniref:Uncharacterized protein n=1 Tax=Neofusicoccum parvum TaxID=310453 RepID=A0ACB5SM79_9PEZI|nr:hypothetical protein GTA08_BOTSDO08113 [Neofusicoccum parvum]